MNREELFKELKCLEIKENKDGSAEIIFEASDKFKKLYLEAFDLSEWSDQHFSETIKNAIDHFYEFNNNVKLSN